MSAKCTTEIRSLSIELQKKAETELNEDSQRLEEYFQHVRDWLKKQPHLIARTDDHFLLCFLRGSKFSLQRTKEKLDYFHSLRTLLPEYFSDRNPLASDIQAILKLGIILQLYPANGVAGPRIMLVRFGACNAKDVPLPVLAKAFFMLLDIFINEDDYAIVAGVHCLVDFENFDPAYILQLSPIVIRNCAMLIQAAYPLRIKHIDYINCPTIFLTVLKIIKKVLSKKLSDRIRLYNAEDILSTSGIPSSILPKEFGGTGESIDVIADKCKKKFESYQEFFEKDSKYCSDEKLRPDISTDDSFGVEGTFRRLNID